MDRGHSMQRLTTLLSVAAAALALSGCFGGGDDAPSPAADPLAAVPATASQTTAGTVDYLNQLAMNQSDTREPIDVTAVVLPTSDDTEPLAVN